MQYDASVPDRRCAPVRNQGQSPCRRAPQRNRRTHPLPHRRHPRRRLACQLRPRAPAWQQGVLQRQPPHQSDERLRRGLPPLCFRPQERRARRLHHGARRSVRNRRLRVHGGGYRVPHCRRPPSRSSVSILPRPLLGLETAFSPGAPEGFHDGRGRLPGQTRQALDPRDLGTTESLRRRLAPGGGAEIFADRIRHIICDHKIDGDQWLETAKLAHQIGLKSNATMLYGHVENDEDRVDHLLKLRELQDETHGFQTFIPLAFHPDNTPLEHLPKTTGMLDIKQIAVSRLVLDNFPHIKAYWQMLTPKIAQIALRFGADDLDGTVIEEKIYHDAGATTPQGMRRQELVRLIKEAGREPVERDTLYRPVMRTETSVTVAV